MNARTFQQADDDRSRDVVLEALAKRRSIRAYTEEAVPPDVVRRILHAASVAPSACNEQPWHFVVVTDRSVLAELADRHPFGAPVRHAPLCVVPCADLELAVITSAAGDFWAQSLAAATQNLLIAASACGLGAVWIGTYPDEPRVRAVREVIGAPEHIVPFCVVPMGYPAETPPPRDPSMSLEAQGRIHTDRW